jgi:hypothetical protein
MKVNVKNYLLATALTTMAAQVVHTIGAWLSLNYYMDPNYRQVWSTLMMPSNGPPPADFYVLSIFFGFISAAILCGFFLLIRNSLSNQYNIIRGLYFSAIVTLVVSIPSTFSMMLLVNFPTGLLLNWLLEMVAINLLTGLIVGWLLRD